MKKKIVIILLILLNIFLLFYKLGDIPRGIHVDEAGSYYDAISINKYGVDRYLYHNPVYFINYGGGQNALYTYLASISFRLFGNSLWSFRLVAVIINLISYYFYYKLIKKTKGNIPSIITLFLLTIFPVFIMKARWGLESYLLCPMLIISIYFYYIAINNKKTIYYILTGILFGLTLYTYAISYLIIFFFILFSYIYLYTTKRITIKNIITISIPLFILALPLILMLLINKGIIKNEIITPILSIPKLWQYREGEISIDNLSDFINNFKVYFIKDFLDYNYINGFGTMYYPSIVLTITGLIISIINIKKKKEDYLNILILSLFIITLIVCSMISELNINKANAIYLCFVYFIILTFEWLYNKRQKIIITILLIIYLISFTFFFKEYYYNNNYIHNYSESQTIKDAIKYADSIRKDNQYICMNINEGYIYVLLYKNISPYDFNKNNNIDYNNNMVNNYKYFRFDYNYECNKNINIYKDIYNTYNDNKYKKIGEYYIYNNLES